MGKPIYPGSAEHPCVCSLCCFGFPCQEYTWESASAEAFAPGAVDAALEADGIQVVDTIRINLALPGR